MPAPWRKEPIYAAVLFYLDLPLQNAFFLRMQSKTGFSRRSFLKGLGAATLAAPWVTSGWASRPPSSVLRHASFGANGMAWADLGELTKYKNSVELVAVADVDLAQTSQVRKQFPGTRIYQDWRVLLEKEGANLDSVNVSTPDHMHAPIAMSAMQLGKHAYVQKPLAHDIYEVRQLKNFAEKHPRIVTQMGIQIHSTAVYRLGVIIIQSGIIGKIKEVHSWCPKSWGDPGPTPTGSDPVPASMNWDLWLGVCEKRPFIGNGYYHPANWRKRLDFGTGTFGDMGCHIFDPVFTALELGAPISVRSEGKPPSNGNWALDSKIHYVFNGTSHTADKTIPITWYDGDQKPPAEVLALLEGDERPNTGSIFVGTSGTMVLPHISHPLLYPDKKYKDIKLPEAEGGDHWGEFVQACLGKAQTSARIQYAAPLTEAVLLGGVASRFPQTTLQWDSAKLLFSETEANKYVRRSYREGWKIKGLS